MNKNRNELVSVVVPIYNVEPYLDRCIRSIVRQTYENLQIILVDDGSPDACPQICDRWEQDDSRIEVIHKSNSGLGLSRNAGLTKARGKYVCFVDSDDYIHETAIQKLYERADKVQADVCYYGCVDVINGVYSEKQPPQKIFYEGEEIRKRFAASLIGNMPDEAKSIFTGMSACYAFYNVAFLKEKNIQFHSERETYISEDLIFNLSVCSYAERISILPESLYYYVIRQSDSLRSTYRGDRFEKSKKMYLKLIEFSVQFKLGNDGILRAKKYMIQATIACIKMELLRDKNYRYVYRMLKEYVSDTVLAEILSDYPIKRLPWKQRIFSWCLKYKMVAVVYLLAYFQNCKMKDYI